MSVVRWLHISDLHLNQKGVENTRLRTGLSSYLKSLSLQCDYVFCTGDLRYAPEGGYAENTVEFLESVCTCVGTPLEHLFVSPGNHDVDRDTDGRDDAIRSEWFTGNPQSNNYDPRIGIIKQHSLDAIMSGTNAFRHTLQKIIEAKETAFSNRISRFGPHTLYKTSDFNVIELDSTISYTKGQERDLIIGTSYLQEALENCDAKKVTLVMTHYSFDYLDRAEQEMIEALFRDYNVHLWISGHEHKNLFRKQRDWFYEFQCGNLLLENGARTCILVGELDLETLHGQITAHAWFSPNGWAQYPFVTFGTPNPSIYRFDLTDYNSSSVPCGVVDRRSLREQILPLLEENQSIFYEFGPTNNNRNILRSEIPTTWETLLKEKIIPNSLKVIETIELHQELLLSSEKSVLEKYKMHILGLEQNHLEPGKFVFDAPRFPDEIFTILK